jgi:hypothetical protein
MADEPSERNIPVGEIAEYMLKLSKGQSVYIVWDNRELQNAFIWLVGIFIVFIIECQSLLYSPLQNCCITMVSALLGHYISACFRSRSQLVSIIWIIIYY